MRKLLIKFISVLLLFMFIFGIFTFAVISASQTSEKNPVYAVIGEKDEFGNTVPDYYTDVNGKAFELNQSELSVNAAEDLPNSYDLRNFKCVTPVKYQGESGSCWAFAFISSVEASLLKQGHGTRSSNNYSEAHLAWFAQRQRTHNTEDPTYGDGIDYTYPYTTGGNWQNAAISVLRGNGLEREENLPWRDMTSEELSKAVIDENLRYVSEAKIKSAYRINSTEKAKKAIIENGNLLFSYYHDKSFFNPNNSCYYQNDFTVSNHSVAIVGWDDSYSRNNFNSSLKPPKDGAWLVKGSWGRDFGIDGYYWISYYDTSISNMATLIASPKDVYDHVYQYDGAFPLQMYEYRKYAVTSNIFTSSRNEKITHVSFYSANDVKLDAEIRIYFTDVNTINGQKYGEVKNLELKRIIKTDALPGYQTVPLDEPIFIEKEQNFLVTLKITDNDGGYVYASVEGDVKCGDGTPMFSSKEGQSFIVDDGIWRDLSNCYGRNNRNATIKVMTQDLFRPEKPDIPDVRTFTLTYDMNNGTNESFCVEGDTEYIITDIKPNRENYTFIGWSQNRQSTVGEYLSGDILTIDEDTVLYAVWKKEEITVSSIRFKSKPSKTLYTYKYDTIIDLTGTEIEVTYSDGSKKTVKDTGEFTASGLNPKKRGVQSISIKYDGLSLTCEISVKYTWWQWIIVILLFGWIWY